MARRPLGLPGLCVVAAAAAAAAGALKTNVHETNVFHDNFRNQHFLAYVFADELGQDPLIVFALEPIHVRNSLRVSDDGLGLRNLH